MCPFKSIVMFLQVHVLDMSVPKWQYDIYNHSEVVSAETWKNILLLGTNEGVQLKDLEETKVNSQSTSKSVCFINLRYIALLIPLLFFQRSNLQAFLLMVPE